jgi:uridine kinase
MRLTTAWILFALCDGAHRITNWLDLRGGSRDKEPQKPLVVAVCGGSGSGKTTLTAIIRDRLGEEHCTLIQHDSYYKNFNHLPMEERALINFDAPEALDSDLLVQHLNQLKRGKAARIPVYDFGSHSRTSKTTMALPRKVILVDGILIFSIPSLLDLFDLRIFVDTADDIRLVRRLRRDMNERNRTLESVVSQYFRTVQPMHKMLVEPSKIHSHIIVPSADGIKDEAVDMVVSRLKDLIKE